MPEATVCVGIPTYNRPDLLSRCLQSVLAGERQPEQVVVCDQSHGDATRRLVESIPTSGHTVVEYLHLSRPSVSRARNAAMQAARTDLLAYIDDDCVAHSGWLAALTASYAAASAAERISAVSGRVLPLAGTGERQVAVSSRRSPRRRLYRAHEGGLERGEWAPWDAGTGGNILVPRDILLEIGGFDASLGPGSDARSAEDIDLLYRLARAGTLVYEPAAVVYHGAASRRRRLSTRYYYGRGMGFMLAKHLVARDRAARHLLILYVRHQIANAARHGAWGPVESALTLAGALGGIARGRTSRAFTGPVAERE